MSMPPPLSVSDPPRLLPHGTLPPGLVHPASGSGNAARETAAPGVAFVPGLHLRAGRVHEACGPARRVFAAWVMAGMQRAGATLWIRPAWGDGRINPHGLADWTDPRALVVVDCAQTHDLLWCAEEALRAGAAALVIVELPEPPALTPVRRLHLAAETGAARIPAAARAIRPAQMQAETMQQTTQTDTRSCGKTNAPLGLLLTPDIGGAAGVESRWWLAPHSASGDADTARAAAPRWQLMRLRARTAPLAQWTVRQTAPGQLHADRLSQPDSPPADTPLADTPQPPPPG